MKIRWPFPIASMLRSSSAVVLGWKVYGDEDTPKYIDKFYSVLVKMYDTKLWFYYRFHPLHRYHIVKTGLKPGYYDVDTVMLNACMSLLCRYVEDECGGVDQLDKWTAELRQEGSEGDGPREVVDSQADSQADRQAEVTAIYRWWKIDHPLDHKNCDEMRHQLFGERRRISFKKCEDDSQFSEMVMEPFNNEENALYDKFRALEKKIDDDEQSMLHRLINIRHSLWT